MEQYNQSIDELLQLGGVHHEEEFRVKAEKYEKVSTLKTRIGMIEAQTKHIQILEGDKHETEVSLKRKLAIITKPCGRNTDGVKYFTS